MEELEQVVVLLSTSLQTRRMQALLMHLEDVARTVVQTLMAVQGQYSSTIQVIAVHRLHIQYHLGRCNNSNSLYYLMYAMQNLYFYSNTSHFIS